MRLFLGSFATIPSYHQIRYTMQPYFEGKWVEPRNLHLTWLFLGERASADPIIEALEPLKQIKREPLTLQDFGTFGKPKPKVFFLKTASQHALPLYHHIIELLGEKPSKPFHPHITLTRIKRFHSFGFKQLNHPWMHQPLGTVEPTIRLIESRLTPSGPIYIPLAEF